MLVSDPYSFFIDDSNNLLISDYGSNSILIFNPLFEFIHKISVSDHPTGIVVDKQRRIIVVSQSNNNCLQIFWYFLLWLCSLSILIFFNSWSWNFSLLFTLSLFRNIFFYSYNFLTFVLNIYVTRASMDLLVTFINNYLLRWEFFAFVSDKFHFSQFLTDF